MSRENSTPPSNPVGRVPSPGASPHLSPLDAPSRRRLPILLRRAWFSLNQAFRRRVAHLGLTPDQFTVLRTLQEHPEGSLSQRELAEIMSSDPNTVASLLERMESQGWIGREKDAADRRAHILRLFPAGQVVYDEARTIAVALQAETLIAIPENQRDLFLEQLASVAEHCRDAAEASPRQKRRETD